MIMSNIIFKSIFFITKLAKNKYISDIDENTLIKYIIDNDDDYFIEV